VVALRWVLISDLGVDRVCCLPYVKRVGYRIVIRAFFLLFGGVRFVTERKVTVPWLLSHDGAGRLISMYLLRECDKTMQLTRKMASSRLLSSSA
jgi:hypothetical protein